MYFEVRVVTAKNNDRTVLEDTCDSVSTMKRHSIKKSKQLKNLWQESNLSFVMAQKNAGTEENLMFPVRLRMN